MAPTESSAEDVAPILRAHFRQHALVARGVSPLGLPAAPVRAGRITLFGSWTALGVCLLVPAIRAAVRGSSPAAREPATMWLLSGANEMVLLENGKTVWRCPQCPFCVESIQFAFFQSRFPVAAWSRLFLRLLSTSILRFAGWGAIVVLGDQTCIVRVCFPVPSMLPPHIHSPIAITSSLRLAVRPVPGSSACRQSRRTMLRLRAAIEM